MGRIKDLATGLEIETGNVEEISPIQYITVDEGELEDFDIDEVNLQLQMAADEVRSQFEPVLEDVMPAGRYYVGDLCYVIDDNEVWREVCSLLFQYNRETRQEENHEGQFTLKDGRTIVIYGTRYGDGTYESNIGTRHSVDAGVIGAMLESDCDQKYEHIAELGAFVDFPEFWTHSGSGGDRREWDGVIRLGHVEIQT
jgi:hypothetical protein